jgi:hypothetical protein
MTPVDLKTRIHHMLEQLEDMQGTLAKIEPHLLGEERTFLRWVEADFSKAKDKLEDMDARLFDRRGLPSPHAFRVGDRVARVASDCFDENPVYVIQKLCWVNGGPWYEGVGDGHDGSISYPEYLLRPYEKK